MRTPLLVLALAMAAACGDNHAVPDPDPDGGVDAPPDSGLDEDGCRILTLGKRDLHFNLFFNQLLGVRYPVTSNLEGGAQDFLNIELYDSTTGGLPALATGAFDLAAQTDLATCQHCVGVELDHTDDGSAPAIYFQSKGTLTLDKVSDPLEPVFAAHSSRIVLRRAQIGEEGHSTFDPVGDCVSIQVAFDTTPTPGLACLNAEDCGNPLLEICDPATNSCAAPQCGDFQSCPGAKQMCVSQYRDLFDGACYTTCNPEGTGCGANHRCVQFGPDPHSGICKTTGTGALGSACEQQDNSTSCTGSAQCSLETGTCAATCSFYAAAPGCPSGTVCSMFGVCEPPSSGNAAALGASCGANAELAEGCGSDGAAFRGLCFSFHDPLVCQRACVPDFGCLAGEFCAVRFTSGLGTCLPLPVCGDGVRGEINEECDDGNTNDDDGCSGDCTAVDTSVYCADAQVLTLGATQQGNTAVGRDGFMSSCQPGFARADLFEVTPPGPGELRLHLTSPTAHTVSLRTTCTDAGSELDCKGGFGAATDERLVLPILDATPATLTAMVSATTFPDEGPYALAAEFIPEVCGDGIRVANEICDDGNTVNGDGCSGDCRAIEYAAACSQAPTLSTSATNAGDTTDALHLYPSSCAADSGTANHPDRLYRYTAPAAGTLHLQLQDNGTLIVVSVLDDCAAPAAVNELACRPAFLGGDVDVTLTAGQQITIVVASYFANEGGTYTLDATFTAQ